MVFSYYGHAAFSLEINGTHLLFDPFISPNELAKGIDVNAIKADYILLSHAHEDHIADALTIAKHTGAKIISSWEIVSWAQKNGIENTHPMNTGGAFDFTFGNVKCLSAVHSSSFPDGSYGGNPMGFLITDKDGNSVYYAGDTALTLDMQLIPKYTSNLLAAVLPIGDNFTMGYKDARIAAEFCEAKHVIGVHYDTFGYIMINHANAISYFCEKEIKLSLPAIGQKVEL